MNTLEEQVVQESTDGTTKYLFKLSDGNLIETVMMKQEYGLSVCVTTQVGCNIGCTFLCEWAFEEKSRLNCWRNRGTNYECAALFGWT